MNDMLPHDSGEDGVWVEVALDSLEKGHYRHAPFGEAYRPFFERMSAMFADMGMGSPEHWEGRLPSRPQAGTGDGLLEADGRVLRTLHAGRELVHRPQKRTVRRTDDLHERWAEVRNWWSC